MTDPTERFSSRVTNYVKYRPALSNGHHRFAHRGVWTDTRSWPMWVRHWPLAELFLKTGNRVLGIEPNREMRGRLAEQLLRSSRALRQHRRATAEATSRPAHSVDSSRRDRLFTGSIASM